MSTGCGSGSHCFDVWARPLKVTRSSSLGYSKTESTEYHDNYNKWVLGQVARTRLLATSLPISSPLPKETSRVEFSATTAQPLRTFAFGKLQQTLAYHPDGTLASVSDGRDSGTLDTSITLADWKRGIPQLVNYPATPDQPTGTSRTAGVDDNGWITAVTDENGSRTCYGYDVVGRITNVTQTSENQSGVCNGSAWSPTTLTFSATGAAIYELPQNHWAQVVTTGNGRHVTRYDAMWRPVVEETFAVDDAAATRSIVVKRYDQAGRLAFQSHPMRTLADYRTVTAGTTTTYDALDRVTEVRVPSVDAPGGVFKTTMEYLSGFVQRTTSPNAAVTTTRFMAWDEPTMQYPARIEHPESTLTVIQRNGLGRPVALTRSGTTGTPTLTRRYVYRPDTEELCKTIEPETGVTVMDHDPAGNLGWSAAGLALTDASNCNLTQAWDSGRRVGRTYDARNRLRALGFPDGNGNQTWSYYADGKPRQISTWNIGFEGADPKETRNLYTFYRRGLPKTEVIAVPAWYTFSVEHGYNANGHLSSQSYPSGRSVSYAVNALGQPTAIASPSESHTYASSISYFPNGTVERFMYGNGIEHRMAQNDRQLPDSSRASFGGTEFIWDELDYDGHGNVLAIADLRPGKAGRRSRTMSYDGLDRLEHVASPMFGAAGATYTYNVFDDLTRVKIGGSAARDHYYCYDAARRLTNIKTGGCDGATVVGLGYDVQGNLQNKNGQQYRFDFGNRLREVEGVERYRYDGHGRRVLAMTFSEGNVLSQYAQDGKLMFQESARTGLHSDMIYLAGSLVAIREEAGSGGTPIVKYQHTDALGSPVVVTRQDRSIVEETEYEPYGKVLNRPTHDGPGYTGHVEDAATGLTYMQQRYYDQGVGRFLSVDPVTANSGTGANFNRYWYANNNPFRFVDPDGRAPCLRSDPNCARGGEPLSRERQRRCAMTCLRDGGEGKKGSTEVAKGGIASKESALMQGAQAHAPDAYRNNQEANWLYVSLSDGTFGYTNPNVGAPGVAIVNLPNVNAIIGKSYGDAAVAGVFAAGHNHLRPDLFFSGADAYTWRTSKVFNNNIPLYLWNFNGDASMLNTRMVQGTPLLEYKGRPMPELNIDPVWKGE